MHAHILSNCHTALTQGRFTWHHNSVLSSLINLVRPFLKDGMTLYSDMPGFQAPNGGTIPPHVLVTALKPDIVGINTLSQEVIVPKLIRPWDSNIVQSHNFKSKKYAPLIADLSHSLIVSFFPHRSDCQRSDDKGQPLMSQIVLSQILYKPSFPKEILHTCFLKSCATILVLYSFHAW